MMEKVRPYLIGAVLTAVLFFSVAQESPGPNNVVLPTWEYLYIEQVAVQFEQIETSGSPKSRLLRSNVLNSLGKDGWEMVQAGVGGYMFKRRAR
tara:strand:+ start:55 stop:336 length:282 start_codon:yes stop_codon:yes gene_type:complete